MKSKVSNSIGKLFSLGLKISGPLSGLHAIREKILARGYYAFYNDDIIHELNRCEEIMDELRNELQDVHDLLNSGVKSKIY